MAIELVTGRAGTPHVDSSDMRALYAEIVGRVRYLLNDYDMGVAEMESSNDCHLMPAELLVDGAHVRITGDGETVHIDNGSSSYDRVDIVALHYTSSGSPGSRVESISVEVVKGTPVRTGGGAKDPAMPSGSATILDGSSDVYVPYVRVKLVGLVPQDPELMLNTLSYTLATAGVQIDQLLSRVTPITAGGTGSSSARGARTNLGLGTSLLYNSMPWYVWESAGYVYVVANGVKTGSGSWDSTECPYTIPSGKRPTIEVFAPVVTSNGDSTTGSLRVNATGKIIVQNNGGTGSANVRYGFIMWPSNGM